MTPTVCDALLARVAGTPSGRLDALAEPEALAAVREAAAAGERQAELAPALEAALHDLVPAPKLDRPLRRAVLALKRDVHNGRAPTPPTESLDRIERLLALRDAARLAEWRRAAGGRQSALAAAGERLEEELARAGRALVEAFAEPELAAGLALASPDLVEQVTGGRTGSAARPESRLARSCTAYVTRAAVKTSPFSALTQVALTGFADAPPALPRGRRSVTLVSRALATDLLRACATDERLAGALRYVANPGLVRSPWPPRLVTPRYTWVDGFAWRHDRVTEVGAYERQLRVLSRLPEAEYGDILNALGGPDAHPAFARMVATGMLQPVAPWSRTELRPLVALADLLDGRSDELAAALRRLDAAADRVGAAPARQRPLALRDLRTDAAAAYATTSTPAPAWLRDAPLVHEDVAPGFALPSLPDGVRDELARLGERMRPHIVRSRIYDELVAHFVARHGSDGFCANVLDLLVSFMARPDAGQVLAAASRADWHAARSGDDPRRDAAVGPGTAPPTAGVFFQVAARDREALADGDFLVVPNQYNPGTGALLARHLPLLAEQPELVETVRGWLRDLYPDALVVELPVAADWNDLQHLGAGLLAPLVWPGELPTEDPAPPLRLADLTAVHDPIRGTLTLVAPDGRPVAPVYLGTVPPHLVLGPLRLLLTLANPWIIAQPEGTLWSAAQQRPAGPREVEHSERVRDGRLVVSRARWRIPPAALPIRGRNEERLDYLARADRWRRAHGIPVEVFMTVARRAPGLSARDRKPVWLRFDSLHTLEAAGRLVDADAVAVDLVESLPGPGERWLCDDSGEPRAAEFVTLLRWPRPAAAPGDCVAARVAAEVAA